MKFQKYLLRKEVRRATHYQEGITDELPSLRIWGPSHLAEGYQGLNENSQGTHPISGFTVCVS